MIVAFDVSSLLRCVPLPGRTISSCRSASDLVQRSSDGRRREASRGRHSVVPHVAWIGRRTRMRQDTPNRSHAGRRTRGPGKGRITAKHCFIPESSSTEGLSCVSGFSRPGGLHRPRGGCLVRPRTGNSRRAQSVPLPWPPGHSEGDAPPPARTRGVPRNQTVPQVVPKVPPDHPLHEQFSVRFTHSRASKQQSPMMGA